MNWIVRILPTYPRTNSKFRIVPTCVRTLMRGLCIVGFLFISKGAPDFVCRPVAMIRLWGRTRKTQQT